MAVPLQRYERGLEKVMAHGGSPVKAGKWIRKGKVLWWCPCEGSKGAEEGGDAMVVPLSPQLCIMSCLKTNSEEERRRGAEY
jgi:hypothetical protein